MIAHMDITGIKCDVDTPLKSYIVKKIGRLDRFLPKNARQTARADVKIRHLNEPNGNKYECYIVLDVPDAQINASDSTMNAFAAVDIVEEKLKNQLKKYKDSRDQLKKGGRHGILRKLKTRLARGDALQS